MEIFTTREGHFKWTAVALFAFFLPGLVVFVGRVRSLPPRPPTVGQMGGLGQINSYSTSTSSSTSTSTSTITTSRSSITKVHLSAKPSTSPRVLSVEWKRR